MNIFKQLKFLCVLSFLCLGQFSALQAQNGQYDVMAQSDCSELDQGNYYVELYLKAHSASTTFRLAEQNYRFSFTDNGAIGNPQLDVTGGMSGIVTDETGQVSFFDNITLTGSLDTVVSFNFELAGGAGYFLNETDWTYIGKVKFDVLNDCLPVGILIHDNQVHNFPPTTILEKYNNFLYTVDEGDYIFENSADCPTGPEGQYSVKAVGDCSEVDQGKYYAEIYLKATDANSTFRLSDQNYRFSFTRFALGNATPDQTGGLDGITVDPTGAVSLYENITTTGSLDSVVSYNIELNGGLGYLITDTDWTYIGRVAFDVLDPSLDVELKIHDKDPANFPPTFIGEVKCDNWYSVDEGEYFEEDCAVDPCTLIDSEDFESGWGIWNDGGNDCHYYNYAPYATSGSKTIRLRDNTAGSDMYTDAMDLSSYDELTVDFAFKAVGMKNGHDFWLQVSTDNGGSFSTVETWVKGVDFQNSQATSTYKTATISGPFTNETVIRFVCDARKNANRIHMDDIVLNACVVPGQNMIAPSQNIEQLHFRSDIEENGNAINLSPNPARSILNLAIELANDADAQLRISDQTGRVISERSLIAQKGSQKTSIDLSAFAPGVYVATLITNSENKTKKFVVVK